MSSEVPSVFGSIFSKYCAIFSLTDGFFSVVVREVGAVAVFAKEGRAINSSNRAVGFILGSEMSTSFYY